jgi:putative flippase GtrA
MEARLLTAEVLPELPLRPSRVLDVVVPVHNEEVALERSLRRLHAYLAASFPYSFRITVAENASSDATVAVARRVAAELPGIEVVVSPGAGRGRALRTAWLASDAQVLAYMDVDLSTDLAALLPLVASLIAGHSDMAIGSRLSRSARVVRGAKREIISRCYNIVLRGTGTTSASDAQCGFKAIRADVAASLLPLVEDDGWFFDTELLWLARRVGLRVHEVPVDWVDDPDSRVNIPATVRADLAGIVRLRCRLLRGQLPLTTLRQRFGRLPLPGVASASPSTRRQLVVFAVIGSLSALAYLLLFLLLRDVGTAQEANLGALLVTTFGNTTANRRWTFGVCGRAGAGRAQLQGLLIFAIGLALTSGALAVLRAAVPAASRVVEIGVLVTATALATVLRFALFRFWVFRLDRSSEAASPQAALSPRTVSAPSGCAEPPGVAPGRRR